MPKILVSLPGSGDAAHDLHDATITVGRLPDNTLQIEDASVSSHHAQLTRANGDYILRDLGSTNGTLLNGKEIAEEEDHRLQDGDAVTFGSIETKYASENPADARPMPESESATAVVASSSVRPADFANASPFQKKATAKDPVGTAILAFAGLSIAAFAGALAVIFAMKSPL